MGLTFKNPRRSGFPVLGEPLDGLRKGIALPARQAALVHLPDVENARSSRGVPGCCTGQATATRICSGPGPVCQTANPGWPGINRRFLLCSANNWNSPLASSHCHRRKPPKRLAPLCFDGGGYQQRGRPLLGGAKASRSALCRDGRATPRRAGWLTRPDDVDHAHILVVLGCSARPRPRSAAADKAGSLRIAGPGPPSPPRHRRATKRPRWCGVARPQRDAVRWLEDEAAVLQRPDTAPLYPGRRHNRSLAIRAEGQQVTACDWAAPTTWGEACRRGRRVGHLRQCGRKEQGAFLFLRQGECCS